MATDRTNCQAVVSSHRDTAVATWHCSTNYLSQFVVGEVPWARIHYQVVVEIMFGDWSATQISKVFQVEAQTGGSFLTKPASLIAAGSYSTHFLFCPCENGALIRATEWMDFFRMKGICVHKRCEKLLPLWIINLEDRGYVSYYFYRLQRIWLGTWNSHNINTLIYQKRLLKQKIFIKWEWLLRPLI